MGNRRLVTIIAVAALIVVAAWGYSYERDKASTPRSLSAATTRGAVFTLATERGKPVVINFFGSWCGPCNMEAPELAAFAQDHADVVFVGVADDQAADADGFMSKYALAYPVIADPRGAILSSWGVKGVPTTVFLDGSGVEKARLVGASTRDQFQAALQKAL
jgi:thiol-disulfide isomerase/thioredoxin